MSNPGKCMAGLTHLMAPLESFRAIAAIHAPIQSFWFFANL